MNTGGIYDEVVRGKGRVVDHGAAEWERTYSMFSHLSLIAWHFVLPVAPALIMWLIKREKSSFVDDHGREALNFQLSLLAYGVGVFVFGLVSCGAGFLLYLPLYALAIVGMILAAIAANKGEYYRYPMTIRFLS